MEQHLGLRMVADDLCRKLPLLLGAALIFAGATSVSPARGQDVIRIGALYPLSGAVAKSGEDTLNAIRLAVDVINGKYPDSHLPFAKPESGVAFQVSTL
jgi:hypothetical protein